MSCYDIGIKLSENKTDPLFYTFLASVFSTIIHLALFLYFYLQKSEIPAFNLNVTGLTLFTGVSLTLVNVCVIMMIFRGGAVSIGFPILLITNLIFTVMAGVFLFEESLSLKSGVGIVFALIAILLLSH